MFPAVNLFSVRVGSLHIHEVNASQHTQKSNESYKLSSTYSEWSIFWVCPLSRVECVFGERELPVIWSLCRLFSGWQNEAHESASAVLTSDGSAEHSTACGWISTNVTHFIEDIHKWHTENRPFILQQPTNFSGCQNQEVLYITCKFLYYIATTILPFNEGINKLY